MDVIRFEFHLRIPDDVGVIGYDDAPPAAWPSYSLTTMRQPTNEMVEACVSNIIARIEGRDDVQDSIVIESPFIVRNSTTSPSQN